VANQRRRRELQGVHFTDRVVLKEFQMTLLASLPSGDCLEGLDVPADERPQRDGLVLLAARHRLVFELYFPVLGPTRGRRRQRKRLAFLMDESLSLPDTNDRGVPRRTVRLLACAYGCHGGIGGDRLFMSPLRHLRNP
jgi:hypothetical protein